MNIPILNNFAIKHELDKADQHHGYMQYYQVILENLTPTHKHLLELGIHKGNSLRMWAEALPDWEIYGLDNNSLRSCPDSYSELNIHQYIGSQNDLDIINKIFNDAGNFDVVVDDASHISPLTIDSFKLIAPRLHKDSIYVIEDLGVCERPECNPYNFSVWQFLESIKNDYKIVQYNDEMVSIQGF